MAEERRRIIGIALRLPVQSELIALDDSRIDRIYYTDLNKTTLGHKQVLSYTTPAEFTNLKHDELTEKERIYVNMFVSKATMRGPNGESSESYRPRAGSDVKKFMTRSTGVQLGSTNFHELSTFVYINNMVGVLECDRALVAHIYDKEYCEGILKSGNIQLQEELRFLHKNMREVKDTLLGDVKESQYEDTVKNTLRSLLLENDAENHTEKDTFDTFCMNLNSGKYDVPDEETLSIVARTIYQTLKYDATLSKRVVYRDFKKRPLNKEELFIKETVSRYLVQLQESDEELRSEWRESSNLAFNGVLGDRQGTDRVEGKNGFTGQNTASEGVKSSGAASGSEVRGQAEGVEGAETGKAEKDSETTERKGRLTDIEERHIEVPVNTGAKTEDYEDTEDLDLNEIIKETEIEVQEEAKEEVTVNNCIIPNCPICHGRGYIISDIGFKVECPNKQRVVLEAKNKPIVKAQDTFKAITRRSAKTSGLIPKQYWDTVWDGDKASDAIKTLAKENGLSVQRRELIEFRKIQQNILQGLLTDALPGLSYFISAPNSSGKTSFVYTVMKVMIAKGLPVVPYVSLTEIADLHKKYLKYIGALSVGELKVTGEAKEDSLTNSINQSSKLDNIERTDEEKEAYIESLKSQSYRYNDFQTTPLLICSMTQNNVSLPIEMATLKSLLDYRGRKNLPTIVFTDLVPSLLGYEYTIGKELNGFSTFLTKDRGYASYDRMYWFELRLTKDSFMAL